MKKIILAIALILPCTAQAIPIVLEDIPSYDWTAGCSPTAASMIMGYYDMNGYDSLLTASGWDQVRQTSYAYDDIFSMANYMHTKPYGGTNTLNIPIGIEGYAAGRGVEIETSSSIATRDLFMHEIDNGRPLILSVSTRGPQYPPNHTIAAFGYHDAGDYFYFASYNTWHEEEVIDWYSWDHHLGYGSKFEMLTIEVLSPVPTPEPATGLLYGAGLLGLSFASRKGRRSPRRF